jgi:kynureninase
MTDVSRAGAEVLDACDELAGVRERFVLPNGVIYLAGNSLGALPRAVPERVAEVVAREWGQGLVRSWTDAGWIDLHRRVGGRIARLIGAGDDEVVAGDSTSVNLFKLLVAGHRLRPSRRVLLTEDGNFPTDGYLIDSVARMCGLRVRRVVAADLPAAITAEVAVMCLTQVDYRTGAMHDLAGLTAIAHAAGAVVLWDLAHSAGAVPVDLAGADADLAVGCGYKYLNGGPGAPAFSYVNRRLHGQLDQPLTGWFGHAEPFALDPAYRPAPGIDRVQCGTPPVLSMSALDAALAAVADVAPAAARAKSVSLTELMITLADARLAPYGVSVATPRESARRGSQVSLRHPEAYGLVQALIARGVIGDFRAPDLARFGLSPLYTRYVDVWDALDRAVAVLAAGEHAKPEHAVRAAVT